MRFEKNAGQTTSGYKETPESVFLSACFDGSEKAATVPASVEARIARAGQVPLLGAVVPDGAADHGEGLAEAGKKVPRDMAMG